MDLQPLIIEYLCRRRTLSLPGLGTLEWLEHRPKRSSDRIFKGPTFSLNHDNKEDSAFDFIDYLSRKAEVPKDHASSIVDEWCQQVVAKVKGAGEVHLHGLGAFYQKEQQIKFKSDQIALQQGGDLSLAFANREHSAKVVNGSNISNGSAYSVWDILLPLILLVLIAILALFLWKSLSPQVDPGAGGGVALEDTDSLENESGREVLDSSQLMPEQAGLAEVDEVDEEPEIDGLDSRAGEDTDTEAQTEYEEAEEPYVEEKVQNGQEDRIVSRAEEGECIVIVGSFKRGDLADLALQRVVDRGLKAYTEGYGDFTRVGVVFDCETQDLYRRLFQLRGDFGEDAWILKYK